jgi:hypothetical protein
VLQRAAADAELAGPLAALSGGMPAACAHASSETIKTSPDPIADRTARGRKIDSKIGMAWSRSCVNRWHCR